MHSNYPAAFQSFPGIPTIANNDQSLVWCAKFTNTPYVHFRGVGTRRADIPFTFFHSHFGLKEMKWRPVFLHGEFFSLTSVALD